MKDYTAQFEEINRCMREIENLTDAQIFINTSGLILKTNNNNDIKLLDVCMSDSGFDSALYTMTKDKIIQILEERKEYLFKLIGEQLSMEVSKS